MAMYTSPLNSMRVAAPCTADWERMRGDGQVRYCDQCNLNVYNLSGMTRAEAETLIANREGRLCVRFYRRADGTVLTDNCPVGLRALKRRASRIANAMISAVLGFLSGFGINLMLSGDENNPLSTPERTMGAVAAFEKPHVAEPENVPGSFAIMGTMSIAPRLEDKRPHGGQTGHRRGKATRVRALKY